MSFNQIRIWLEKLRSSSKMGIPPVGAKQMERTIFGLTFFLTSLGVILETSPGAKDTWLIRVDPQWRRRWKGELVRK